jgi:hypothetical protein
MGGDGPLVFLPSESLDEPSSSAWKRRFSSRKIWPSWPALTACSTSSPTQSLRKVTGLLRSSSSFLACRWRTLRWVSLGSSDKRAAQQTGRTTGASEYFSTLWPSGRPRCDIRMTEAAPAGSGCLPSAARHMAVYRCKCKREPRTLLDGMLDGGEGGDDTLRRGQGGRARSARAAPRLGTEPELARATATYGGVGDLAGRLVLGDVEV